MSTKIPGMVHLCHILCDSLYIITRATDSENCVISPQLAITETVEFDLDEFQNSVFDVRRRHLPLLE